MAVCAFVILFLSLLALLFMHYFKRELKQTISVQQMTLATVVAQDIDQKLGFAQKALVADALEVAPRVVSDPEAAQRFLDSRSGTRSIFDHGLTLLSREGRIIAESPSQHGRRGRDLSFREFYKKTVATGQPFISAPFVSSRVSGAPLIVFTAPVRDAKGELAAVLIGGVNLSQNNFLGDLSRTRIGSSGYLYLISPDRSLIMHPERSRIMADKVPPGANKLLDRALEGFEGVEENVTSTGLRTLTSFKRLQATDWVVGTDYPLSEAYAPFYRARKYCIAAVLASAILAILVIHRMMGIYTAALVRFARHVREISSKKGPERLFRLDTRDEIGLLAQTFNIMIQDHDAKNEELLHISNHDALTGLYNRAYFDEEIKRISSGRNSPVSVVMADIDGLKVCNDRYGHPVGDELIKATSEILLESFRTEDVVARIGGDEFAVLLPGVDTEQAKLAMKRVRSLAEKYEALVEGIPMSLSLGYATVDTCAELPEAIKHADQQMYLNKLARKVEKESEL